MTITEIINQLANKISPDLHLARLHIEGMVLSVKVLDARRVWNRIDVKVTPFTGVGEKWVDASRLIPWDVPVKEVIRGDNEKHYNYRE